MQILSILGGSSLGFPPLFSFTLLRAHLCQGNRIGNSHSEACPCSSTWPRAAYALAQQLFYALLSVFFLGSCPHSLSTEGHLPLPTLLHPAPYQAPRTALSAQPPDADVHGPAALPGPPFAGTEGPPEGDSEGCWDAGIACPAFPASSHSTFFNTPSCI